jgi:CBS-domain-containing membrane protein
MLGGVGWGFLATPVLAGALAIVAVALACNNLMPGRKYPLYWA